MPKKYINEGDPMPAQPDADGERQKFPRFTMTGTGVTIQAEVGGVNIAFERLVDATIDPQGMNEELDQFFAYIHRQKARAGVRTLMADMAKAKLAITSLPEKKRTYMVERAADRARLLASFSAAWGVSNKRGEFKLTAAQEGALQAHDADTQVKATEIDREAKNAELVIPFLKGEISKLQRQIAGHDDIDAPIEDEEEQLSQAAE